MKKILTITLTVALLFCLTATTLAQGTAYLDYMVGGTAKEPGKEEDLNLFAVGVDVPIDAWKVAFDYYSGKYDKSKLDNTGFLLKGGYAFINDDANRFGVTLGYANKNLKGSGTDIKLTTFTLGLDGSWNINDNAAFFLNLDFGINPKYENSGAPDKDGSFLTYRLGFDYFFNEIFGLGLGYRGQNWKPDGSSETTESGFIVNFAFKF